MAGGAPFTVQSPTQSSRFVPYSPTSKSNNYSYEQHQHQHPPQTPPSFAPTTVAHSPRFGYPVADSSPQSAMNGNGYHHPDASQHYHINSVSPHQQPSRIISGPTIDTNGHASYNNVAPSHAHPSSRQGSLALSPNHEHGSAANHQRLNVANLGDTPSVAQSSRPSSGEVNELPNPIHTKCTNNAQAETCPNKRSNVLRQHFVRACDEGIFFTEQSIDCLKIISSAPWRDRAFEDRENQDGN